MAGKVVATLVVPGRISPMTDDEVMQALRSDTPLNRARAEFTNAWGTIELAAMQRKPPGPIEIRRMEFEAVEAIVRAYVEHSLGLSQSNAKETT